MSKNYNLHNRAAVSTFSQAPPSSPDPGRHLYSDVAASRSPSPNQDRENPSVDADQVGQSTLSGPPPSGPPLMGANYSIKYKFPVHADRNQVSEETTEEPGMSSPWQTVERQRARSLDSSEPAPRKSGQRGQAPKEKIPAVTTKRSNVIHTAAETRHEAVQPRRGTSTGPQDEEPSQTKGKGRDPHKWRNIYLNKDEIDAEMQQATYESYKGHGQHIKHKKRHGHHHKFNENHEPLPHQTIPLESRPVAQITLDSFLGVALENLKRRGGDPSDDPTASSSSTDEDESDEGRSETSLDSSGPASHRQCRRCSRSKSKAKKGKSALKLIPPKTYDGSADARAYHQFI
jgi:hypothetical protein